MTLGTSLFWITILVLVILGIRYTTRQKKWRLVAKIVGGLAILGVILGFAVWAWGSYKDRPQPVDTLGSLSLGMSPLEVTLAAGKPDIESKPDEIDGSRRYLYKDYSGDVEYFVRFSDVNENSDERVDLICTSNYAHHVFGLSKYSSEKEVTKKLGEPTSQSIRKDGLAKIISYENWKVAFEIEKKSVTEVCVSSSGKVSYREEYGLDE